MKVAWLMLSLGISSITLYGCMTADGATDIADQDQPLGQVTPATEPTAAAPAPTAPTTVAASPAIQAIAQAPDPSSAVQAYATAIGAEPGSVAAESAYLKRMIELGVPAMAEAQAQDLMLRDPNEREFLAIGAERRTARTAAGRDLSRFARRQIEQLDLETHDRLRGVGQIPAIR